MDFPFKKVSQRQQQVGEQLRLHLSKIFPLLLEWEVSLKKTHYSLTKVHMSADLRHATVFISLFGANEKKSKEILAILKKLRPQLQDQLKNKITLRFLPILAFKLDKSLDYREEVENLLKASSLTDSEETE